MSESIELHVVRFPIPANGDLSAHIDLLEEYEQVITGWDRNDIAVPSFEQWSYITHRSGKLRDRQKEQSRGEIQFAAIESLVFLLEKCNLALVRKQTADSKVHANSGYETLKLSLELLQQLHLGQRYQKRLNELFEYYVMDSASVINWEQFGQVPQAQSGMRHVLEKLLNQVVIAHTDQLVQTERALGVAEGATALMIQTGACQPEDAHRLLSVIKGKIRAPAAPVWNSLFAGRKKR